MYSANNVMDQKNVSSPAGTTSFNPLEIQLILKSGTNKIIYTSDTKKSSSASELPKKSDKIRHQILNHSKTNIFDTESLQNSDTNFVLQKESKNKSLQIVRYSIDKTPQYPTPKMKLHCNLSKILEERSMNLQQQSEKTSRHNDNHLTINSDKFLKISPEIKKELPNQANKNSSQSALYQEQEFQDKYCKSESNSENSNTWNKQFSILKNKWQSKNELPNQANKNSSQSALYQEQEFQDKYCKSESNSENSNTWNKQFSILKNKWQSQNDFNPTNFLFDVSISDNLQSKNIKIPTTEL